MKAQTTYTATMKVLKGDVELTPEVPQSEAYINANRAVRYLMHGYNNRGLGINDINWNLVDALDRQVK